MAKQPKRTADTRMAKQPRMFRKNIHKSAYSNKPNTVKKNGPVCEWAHTPPKECIACNQTTWDIDRDGADDEEGEFVLFKKHDTNLAGVKYPMGNECYSCFSCRRKFFHPPITCMDLRQKRDADTDLDAKYLALRRAVVRTSNEFKAEAKVDVDIYSVERKKSAFSQQYREGTWYDLWTFVSDRKLGYSRTSDDEETVLEALEKKVPRVRIRAQ